MLGHALKACIVFSFKSLIICSTKLKSKMAQFHCCKCYLTAILLQGGVFVIAVSHYSVRDNGLAHKEPRKVMRGQCRSPTC